MKSLLIAAAGSVLAMAAAPVIAQQQPPQPAPTQPKTMPAGTPMPPGQAQTPSQPAVPGQSMSPDRMTPPGQTVRPGQMMPETPDQPKTDPQMPRTAPATPPTASRQPAGGPGQGSGPVPYQTQGGGQGDMSYGRWDDNWGARPPAPPEEFSRQNDWYRHVRACQQRYKTYNPSTDMFVPRVGRTARCTL